MSSSPDTEQDLQQFVTSLEEELEAWKKKAERMHLVLDAIKDGLWDYNLQNGEVYFNPRYYTMLGYEPYELPQDRQTWIDLLHPEDREKTLAHVDACAAANKGWSVEFRLRCKDGTYRWILGRGHVTYLSETGTPLRRVGTHTEAQHAVQTSLGGYQSIDGLIAEGGRLYEQRKTAYEMITQIPGITCVKPKGAMYLFPKVDIKKFNITNDEQFMLDLLINKKVLLVQGTGFNWIQPDHFRVIFLPRVHELKEAITGIGDFLSTYQQR